MLTLEQTILLAGIVLGGILGLIVFLSMCFRVTVPTSETHSVQTAKGNKSYGAGQSTGNSYYKWPSWIPYIGTQVTKMDVSIFGIELPNYEAYDKGRLPFVVDAEAFFRISNPEIAAQRVFSIDELQKQLRTIVEGAIRTILAKSEIEEIMENRAIYGEQFTSEIEEQLTHWGVVAVKNIELMDIRDAKGSQVIENIMAKKKSQIEMESRTEVAKNRKMAEISEIESKREVDIQRQDALQQVGLRRAENERLVAIAEQEKVQAVAEQVKITMEKEMAVKLVENVKQAEIQKQVQIIEANQKAETLTISAENQKSTQKLIAEGKYEAEKLESDGVRVQGLARAEADRALAMVPVEAQIALADKIGGDAKYQEYLLGVERIRSEQAVGIAQANALAKAEMKIIANTGNVNSGINNISTLLTPQGGSSLGAMIEGFKNTEVGKDILSKVGIE